MHFPKDEFGEVHIFFERSRVFVIILFPCQLNISIAQVSSAQLYCVIYSP